MIKEYITDICDLLKIEAPKISFDSTNFKTKTTLAQCEPELNVIYLNKIAKPNPDYFFSIAHELRHIWQYKTDKQFYFSKYKPSDNCLSIEEYTLQIAEIDANAFAAIVMADCFRLQPQWNGLSNKVIDSIDKRIKFILCELLRS